VNQRFTYLGDTVVEVVIDGGSVTWSVLPPVPGDVPAVSAPLLPPDPAPVAAVKQQEAILAAPLPEAVQCAAAPPPTLKRRSLMGVIRATKTILFTVGGEALVYAANNLAGLNLPPGLGLVVGATAYGVQKAIKPDGLL
jgi:hypothetical protein